MSVEYSEEDLRRVMGYNLRNVHPSEREQLKDFQIFILNYLNTREKSIMQQILSKSKNWQVTIPGKIKIDKIQGIFPEKIGSESSYGSVYRIKYDGNDDQFVIKVMYFSNPIVLQNGNIKEGKVQEKEKNIFRNEVSVGSKQELYTTKSGTRIVAQYLDRNYGVYIMDSFLRGDGTLKASQLSAYILQKYGKSCPIKSDPILTMLNKSLFEFYKITGGYHGDLHQNNIVVVTKKNSNIKTAKPLYVLIFDYGAHVRFKTKVPCKTLLDVFKKINSEFKNNSKKYGHNSWGGVKTIFKKGVQPYRSNYNLMLHHSLLSSGPKSNASTTGSISTNTNSNSSFKTARSKFSKKS
jgi:hypothetical protein